MAKRTRTGETKLRKSKSPPSKKGIALEHEQKRALDDKRQETLSQLVEEQLRNVDSRIETFVRQLDLSPSEQDRCGANILRQQAPHYAQVLADVWKKSWNTFRMCKRECGGICACLYEARMMVSRNQAKRLSECFAEMTHILTRCARIRFPEKNAEYVREKTNLIVQFLNAKWEPPKERAARTQLVCKNAPRHEPFRSVLAHALDIEIPETSQVDDVLSLILNSQNDQSNNNQEDEFARPAKRRRVEKSAANHVTPVHQRRHDITSTNLPPLPAVFSSDMGNGVSFNVPPAQTISIQPLNSVGGGPIQVQRLVAEPIPHFTKQEGHIRLPIPDLPSLPVLHPLDGVSPPSDKMNIQMPTVSQLVQQTPIRTQGGQSLFLVDQLFHCVNPKVPRNCRMCVEKEIQIKAMAARIQTLEKQADATRNAVKGLLSIGSSIR